MLGSQRGYSDNAVFVTTVFLFLFVLLINTHAGIFSELATVFEDVILFSSTLLIPMFFIIHPYAVFTSSANKPELLTKPRVKLVAKTLEA